MCETGFLIPCTAVRGPVKISCFCVLNLIGNADTPDKVGKSGIGTYGIETRVNLEIDQLIRALAIGPFERFEGMLVLAEADVDQGKFILVDIASLGLRFQSRNHAVGIHLVTRNSVNVSDIGLHGKVSREKILGPAHFAQSLYVHLLLLVHQAAVPVGQSIVWIQFERSGEQLFERSVVLLRIEIMPAEMQINDGAHWIEVKCAPAFYQRLVVPSGGEKKMRVPVMGVLCCAGSPAISVSFSGASGNTVGCLYAIHERTQPQIALE